MFEKIVEIVAVNLTLAFSGYVVKKVKDQISEGKVLEALKSLWEWSGPGDSSPEDSETLLYKVAKDGVWALHGHNYLSFPYIRHWTLEEIQEQAGLLGTPKRDIREALMVLMKDKMLEFNGYGYILSEGASSQVDFVVWYGIIDWSSDEATHSSEDT